MEMATAARFWTRADLKQLPDDGNRYEVLDGSLLVTPQASAPHQDVATFLSTVLRAYCDRHSVGVVLAPAAIPFGPGKKNELQPDISVVPVERSQLAAGWAALPRPILVVEILSTSTRGRDLGIKRDAYVKLSSPDYWIVDARARAITVVRPDRTDEVCTGILRWHPSGAPAALEIRLDSAFP